jgi:hypothetical protein
MTVGDASFFQLVVDDHSRYMWVEMLKSKDQALECFKRIKLRAETESDCKLKALRTDRGGEFTSNLFSIFCSQGGIKHYTTTPYSPQQNGVVERRNQTVVEMARCMLKSMQVPSEFWGEAVCTAVYILNRSPTRSLNNKTPFEAWHGKKPKVNHLRTFGCTAYVKSVGPGLKKLSDRSKKMVFIGYESGTKGYRFFDPTDNKLVVSRDVVFDEKQPWDWKNEMGSTSQQSGTFVIHYDMPDQNPTTGVVAENPGAENQGGVFDDQGAAEENEPATPNPQNNPGDVAAPAGPWATPPSHHSEDTLGGPLRFRTLNDLFDSTEELQEYEYSGVCLLAAVSQVVWMRH